MEIRHLTCYHGSLLRSAAALFTRIYNQPEEVLFKRLTNIFDDGGWRLAYEKDFKVAALYQVTDRLHSGSVVFIDSLAAAESGGGHGAAMLDHLASYALAAGCCAVILDCRVDNTEALRFYDRRMVRRSFGYIMEVK